MTRLLTGVLMAALAPSALMGQTAPPSNSPPGVIETAAIAPRAVSSIPARESRVFELRTYHAAAGKLDALHSRFRDHTVRIMTRHGIESVGFWVPRENDGNNLIVLHAYPNAAARTAAWQRFAIDSEWRKVKAQSEADGKLVDQIDEVILSPTDFCPVVAGAKDGKARCFELRTVRGAPPATLAGRYREHALKLFAQHGLTHVATWSPTGGKMADGVALVTLIAADSAGTYTKAVKSFRDDPFWSSISTASDEGWRSLQDGGDCLLLLPTDYSPLK